MTCKSDEKQGPCHGQRIARRIERHAAAEELKWPRPIEDNDEDGNANCRDRNKERISDAAQDSASKVDTGDQAAPARKPVSRRLAHMRKGERDDGKQPIVLLLQEQEREHDGQRPPARIVMRHVACAHVEPQRKRGEPGAETFEHDVGRNGAELRARNGERHRNRPCHDARDAVYEQPAGDQPGQHDRQHPSGEARQDAEPMIDAADAEDQTQHEGVQRHPVSYLLEPNQEPQRIERAQGNGEVEAEKVMGGAIGLQVAPEAAWIFEIGREHRQGERQRDGGHDRRHAEIEEMGARG
jgi:hypothetical protein